MKPVLESDAICVNTMKLLGDFWTLRIIEALGRSEERFCDLQRAIGNCNPVTLTDRLKKLEEAHLVHRAVETSDKNCVTYSLTGRGREALPVIDALTAFAAKFRAS